MLLFNQVTPYHKALISIKSNNVTQYVTFYQVTPYHNALLSIKCNNVTQ